jgi:hypothetical protein
MIYVSRAINSRRPAILLSVTELRLKISFALIYLLGSVIEEISSNGYNDEHRRRCIRSVISFIDIPSLYEGKTMRTHMNTNMNMNRKRKRITQAAFSKVTSHPILLFDRKAF